MDDLKALESIGLALPSPAYLIGAILFGIIGIAGYRYGKKAGLTYPKWIGIGLMLFPYAVGGGLCVALYIFRKLSFERS